MVVNHLCIELSNVMQLIFDHTFGKQEQQDLVICKPMAIFDAEEEAEGVDCRAEAGDQGGVRPLRYRWIGHH